MRDILLEKVFEAERWEAAINKGVFKGIDKGELRQLCSPETRIRLAMAILEDNYEIAPPHQALIPKDNGEFRTVYVNENIDRIFLSIVNDLLFELCSDMIHPACKSYQKGIGCGKIVQEITKNIKWQKEYEDLESKTFGIKADLSKYFDSVPIEFIDNVFDQLVHKFGDSKIIAILRKYYHTDLCFDPDGNLIKHYQSLKQGCAVASWLADVMLYEIDDHLSELKGMYVRYSDDILYIGRFYDYAMKVLEKNLEIMSMKLNPKKVEYLSYDRWFKFLGFMIKEDQITLSPGRVKTFQKEIEKRSVKNRHVSGKAAIISINRYLYKGDGTYSWATQVLPIINVERDIDTLNEFVMDCIRACQTGKRKIGGLGTITNQKDYMILRGTGKNVSANRKNTEKEIEGYYSIRCMQKALNICRPVYDTIVREM
ncbi:reverse transcriptase domain-containing protein [Eubacterium ventriosum]|jgi:hypothetical protein|uniref:reverse transcriptase domain-containing protein n=1 Tax=Eubacterium ventriosum TaxID=39496 RepID=UPI0039947BA1